MAVALLAVAVLATADGAARAQDDGVDTLAEGKQTESPHSQAVPVDKLLHTALHKPRPGQQARDQRLVAREEQAQREISRLSDRLQQVLVEAQARSEETVLSIRAKYQAQNLKLYTLDPKPFNLNPVEHPHQVSGTDLNLKP